MLHDFITSHREEIIRRCRTKVAARSVPPVAQGEIEGGVPLFLAQLADALRSTQGSGLEMNDSAAKHGHALLLRGFTVSQVVHDYGDVCQSITELAGEKDVPISVGDFQMLNQSLDNAIAAAVTQYEHGHSRPPADGGSEEENLRLHFLTHELRNLVNTALLAFDVLQTGNVGVGGSTGNVLHRSLMRLRGLIERSLVEVRLTQGVQHRELFLVSEFVEQLASAARLEAHSRGVTLSVEHLEAEGAAIDADRQVLSAAVGNLLQNAFKFTHPHTTVTLRARARAERVLIEVEDECGGLPDGTAAEDLFRPFEQRGADRSGLGLGLAFCRWAVEASQGQVSARTLPRKGCVFTIDLPRMPAAAAAVSSDSQEQAQIGTIQ
jgi:hypothetical protein